MDYLRISLTSSTNLPLHYLPFSLTSSNQPTNQPSLYTSSLAYPYPDLWTFSASCLSASIILAPPPANVMGRRGFPLLEYIIGHQSLPRRPSRPDLSSFRALALMFIGRWAGIYIQEQVMVR
ncbi:hypothetical protein Pcinc_043893 [Petrolisthes cinctipes]|uniref:Uncharacterized protein n=1 Tax=Petrolisthes cinctipes TaxID=88211 RepID=A0AAE1BFR9_PETCI|nr:hypothetical protein Pcinc_043893 [Petrolisthes cinctipes]